MKNASNAVGEASPRWYAASLAQMLKPSLRKRLYTRVSCDKAVTARPKSVPHCTTRVNASWQPGGRSLKFHLVLMHRICRWRTRRQLRHKVPGQESAVGWESNSAFYLYFRFSSITVNALASSIALRAFIPLLCLLRRALIGVRKSVLPLTELRKKRLKSVRSPRHKAARVTHFSAVSARVASAL